jgi:putative toxin-antitoxin system antitoxin component (TIGR02293 family)
MKLAKKMPETASDFYGRSIILMGMKGAKGFAHIHSNTDFIAVIRDGVPRKALDSLMENTGITINEMAHIIKTSDRTLRRYTPQQKLDPGQSERLIELATLYSRGEDVFGTMEAFKEWMDSNIIALGNKKPKEFLDTSLGIDLLMEELGRIEHGIFA